MSGMVRASREMRCGALIIEAVEFHGDEEMRLYIRRPSSGAFIGLPFEEVPDLLTALVNVVGEVCEDMLDNIR